jgi:hypothetical protein
MIDILPDMCSPQPQQAAEKARASFRGAPKARARNPETQEIPMFWIPGPPLCGVPE